MISTTSPWSARLHAIGRAGAKPTPPLNLVADFGGGALYLAFGMACAMIEAQRSGKGQVVDAAMTEGAASLMTMFYGLHAAGLHRLERGTNLLDSGSAIYETYECADGRFRRHRGAGAEIPRGAVRASRPSLHDR